MRHDSGGGGTRVAERHSALDASDQFLFAGCMIYVSYVCDGVGTHSQSHSDLFASMRNAS